MNNREPLIGPGFAAIPDAMVVICCIVLLAPAPLMMIWVAFEGYTWLQTGRFIEKPMSSWLGVQHIIDWWWATSALVPLAILALLFYAAVIWIIGTYWEARRRSR